MQDLSDRISQHRDQLLKDLVRISGVGTAFPRPMPGPGATPQQRIDELRKVFASLLNIDLPHFAATLQAVSDEDVRKALGKAFAASTTTRQDMIREISVAENEIRQEDTAAQNLPANPGNAAIDAIATGAQKRLIHIVNAWAPRQLGTLLRRFRADIVRALVQIAGAESMTVRPIQGQEAGPTPEQRLERLRRALPSLETSLSEFAATIYAEPYPRLIEALRGFAPGYDLELTPWGVGSGVRASGRRRIVAGTDGAGLLHIRTFDAAGFRTDTFEMTDGQGVLHLRSEDASGNVLSDQLETNLPPAQADAIRKLKQRLAALMPPQHVLTDAETAGVIGDVRTIIDQSMGAVTGPAPPALRLIGAIARAEARIRQEADAVRSHLADINAAGISASIDDIARTARGPLIDIVNNWLPISKVFVAVHGIGDQFQNQTVQTVAFQVCDYVGQPAAIPLGRFHSPGARVGVFLPEPGRDPELDCGFAEIYWAGVPRVPAAEKHTLEEPRKWARTLIERLRLNSLAGRDPEARQVEKKERRADARVEELLQEAIQGVTVADRVCSLAERAGLFKINLKEILDAFLNDVQVVTEFEEYREQLLDIFNTLMNKIGQYFPASEIYIVAHSEGTVVSFMGLLMGLYEKSPWVGKVRGYMTIGSPLNKHVFFWPELFDQFRSSHADPEMKKHPIPWKNYYDHGDPIAYELGLTREWLEKRGWAPYFRFTKADDKGFARYYFPGAAHNEYWTDDEVFGHFIQQVVDRPPDSAGEPAGPRTWRDRLLGWFRRPPAPAARKEMILQPSRDEPYTGPVTRWFAALVSYPMPYFLASALLFLACFLLYSAVRGCLDPIGARFETPGEVFRNVLAMWGVIAGMSLLARIPALGAHPAWWLLAVVLGVGSTCLYFGFSGPNRDSIQQFLGGADAAGGWPDRFRESYDFWLLVAAVAAFLPALLFEAAQPVARMLVPAIVWILILRNGLAPFSAAAGLRLQDLPLDGLFATSAGLGGGLLAAYWALRRLLPRQTTFVNPYIHAVAWVLLGLATWLFVPWAGGLPLVPMALTSGAFGLGLVLVARIVGRLIRAQEARAPLPAAAPAAPAPAAPPAPPANEDRIGSALFLAEAVGWSVLGFTALFAVSRFFATNPGLKETVLNVPVEGVAVISVAWVVALSAWAVSYIHPGYGTRPLVHTGGLILLLIVATQIYLHSARGDGQVDHATAARAAGQYISDILRQRMENLGRVGPTSESGVPLPRPPYDVVLVRNLADAKDIPGAPQGARPGAELRLMFWGDVGKVPSSDRNLVIAGVDAVGLLHIRVFDTNGVRTDIDERTDGRTLHLVFANASGNVLSDIPESKMPAAQAQAVAALKRQLPELLTRQDPVNAARALQLPESASRQDLAEAEQGKISSSLTSVEPSNFLKVFQLPGSASREDSVDAEKGRNLVRQTVINTLATLEKELQEPGLLPRQPLGDAERAQILNHVAVINDLARPPRLVVAAVNDLLHFRIYDKGHLILSRNETQLLQETDDRRDPERRKQQAMKESLRALKDRLASLWPPYRLTKGDEDEVVTAAARILGRTPPISSDYPIPRDEWPMILDAAGLDQLVERAAEQGPIWPVLPAGAAFLYLWWLAIVLFDMTFIWHLYVRWSGAQKLAIQRLREAGTLPTDLPPSVPPRPILPSSGSGDSGSPAAPTVAVALEATAMKAPPQATAADLKAMPWPDGSNVPSSPNLIVVGTDPADLLHIRIFDASGAFADIFEAMDSSGALRLQSADASGKILSDQRQSDLPAAQTQAITALKQRLPDLLSRHELTEAEKQQAIADVTAIIGHPPSS
jgi:hypothetical protein